VRTHGSVRSVAGCQAQAAAADTTPVRTYGGFVDTYYAWDFDRPPKFDRAYTTQPARHAERQACFPPGARHEAA